MKKNILTPAGLERLKKKLAALLEKRKRLVVELEEARQMGDLAENTAYHELKNQLMILENQIEELETIVVNAQVVTSDKKEKDAVVLGSKVTLAVNGSTRKLEVVGDGEADPLKGQISYSSPLAQALLGKKKGEKVKVATPSGQTVYEILAIEN